ncbi:hypothetical protein [Sulfurimonas sp.]|uniref:hypothetical protein n=1 Tax=Sulfurimonas sp. TaxID=2022749 RepID=UPI003D0AC3F7
MAFKFIIYSFAYDSNNGGTMVLHFLCHLLNQNGYEAYIWRADQPFYRSVFSKKYLKYLKIQKQPFYTNPLWNTPLATKETLDNAIVIYPEITNGNPLKAKHVIRWLLHKPAFHSGKVEFGKNELILGYGKNFSTQKYPITDHNLLSIKYIMREIFQQTNFGPRDGSCHMIRKGKNKQFVHDKNSVLVDDFSQQELAKIFNKVEYFISYDPYTFYSRYASLCGCKSIIIPDEGVPKEAWHPDERLHYGIAYGFDDIDYALNTRDKMLEQLDIEEEKNIESIQKLVHMCKEYFQ